MKHLYNNWRPLYFWGMVEIWKEATLILREIGTRKTLCQEVFKVAQGFHRTQVGKHWFNFHLVEYHLEVTSRKLNYWNQRKEFYNKGFWPTHPFYRSWKGLEIVFLQKLVIFFHSFFLFSFVLLFFFSSFL